MEHLEYYIMNLYEHKKNKSDIKFGINRFSPRKRNFAIVLLISLFVFLFIMITLLFILPNNFWFLFGLIPFLIVMLILLIDRSNIVIAVFNGQKSGTKNTVEYAKRKGVKVINVLNK